jgi:hypothetical protein
MIDRAVRRTTKDHAGDVTMLKKIGKGPDMGTIRIFMQSVGREIDIPVKKIELSTGMIVLSGEVKTPCDVIIQNDDVVTVIGQDRKPVCRFWLQVYSGITCNAGERLSFSVPLGIGNVANMSMVDHTLDVAL